MIVGGGFAGLQLAKTLNNRRKKVILIDKVNNHMFQPLFYQVACGRIEPSNISFPFRKIFQRSRNVQYRMTEVQRILPEQNKIVTEDGEFTYDKLVIATGCKTNFFGNGKMESLAFGMKNTQEAIRIADTAWLLGIRSIAIGPRFVHLDVGPESVWGYDNLPVYRGPGSIKAGGLERGYR